MLAIKVTHEQVLDEQSTDGRRFVGTGVWMKEADGETEEVTEKYIIL